MKSKEGNKKPLVNQELKDRYYRLLEKERLSKTSSKEDQSITLKELRELGISTEPRMVISFNEKKK